MGKKESDCIACPVLPSSSGAPDCPRTAAPSAFPSALVTIAAAPGATFARSSARPAAATRSPVP